MTKKQLPRFVGHRGTRDQRPENTKEAFDYVYSFKSLFETMGSSVSFEFDVRLTKDKVPVLIHDETLGRTAGIQAPVSNFTYEEMKQLNFNNHMKHLPGTLITLEEMFQYYPDIVFDAEIKERGARGIELANIFIELINKYDAADRIIMHIPCLEVSQYAKDNFPTGCRFELPGSLIEDFCRRVYNNEAAEYIEGYHQICMEFRGMIGNELVEFVAPEFVERTRNLGYQIVTYWENRSLPKLDEPLLRRAIELGADSVIVDDTLQALKVFADYSATEENLC